MPKPFGGVATRQTGLGVRGYCIRVPVPPDVPHPPGDDGFSGWHCTAVALRRPPLLIADDTGIRGKGNIQIELTTGQRTGQEDGTRETTVTRHVAGAGLDGKRSLYEQENPGLAPRPGLTPPRPISPGLRAAPSVSENRPALVGRWRVPQNAPA